MVDKIKKYIKKSTAQIWALRLISKMEDKIKTF